MKNTNPSIRRELLKSPEPNICDKLVLHNLVSKIEPDAHVEPTKELVQTTKRNLKSPAIELPKLATNRSHNFAVRRELNHVVFKPASPALVAHLSNAWRQPFRPAQRDITR